MPEVPHVALLIETSRSYGRELLRGVRRYLAEHGPWSIYVELRALGSGVPPWLENWQGDGVLTRTYSQQAADKITALNVPTIELRATKLDHDFPFVGVDNRAMGRLIADHLVERGFKQFACYTLTTEAFFEERTANFIATVEAADFDCSVFHAEAQGESPERWEEHQQHLVAWLQSLPKPIGIMACNDQLGFWLLDACNRAGLAVPDDVAVVGVENDETLCEMATPSMSSVRFDASRIGYEAANLLDLMMRDDTRPKQQTLFPPDGIVTRRSSDVIAVDDPIVIRALQYIRDNADQPIRVDQTARAVHVSRSALERHMRSAIGTSPKAAILRARLQRIQDYLVQTELPLTEIADRLHFRHPQYMSELFKKKTGQTPGSYRESFHSRVDS